jgi:hypothetical protein
MRCFRQWDCSQFACGMLAFAPTCHASDARLACPSTIGMHACQKQADRANFRAMLSRRPSVRSPTRLFASPRKDHPPKTPAFGPGTDSEITSKQFLGGTLPRRLPRMFLRMGAAAVGRGIICLAGQDTPLVCMRRAPHFLVRTPTLWSGPSHMPSPVLPSLPPPPSPVICL